VIVQVQRWSRGADVQRCRHADMEACFGGGD
jgi:hypothetical protein